MCTTAQVTPFACTQGGTRVLFVRSVLFFVCVCCLCSSSSRSVPVCAFALLLTLGTHKIKSTSIILHAMFFFFFFYCKSKNNGSSANASSLCNAELLTNEDTREKLHPDLHFHSRNTKWLASDKLPAIQLALFLHNAFNEEVNRKREADNTR